MKTRTLFLILFLFIGVLPAYAQYQPTAIEGATWFIFNHVETATEEYIDHHIINIKGDTVINGLVYRKVFKRKIDSDAYSLSDFTPPYATITNELIGFIRDDVAAEQVYMIPANNISLCQAEEENLLYDFSINEGDNLNGCLLDSFFTVNSIEQEVIWGQDRQTFFTSDHKFIEGIGGNEGLFSSTDIFILGVFILMVDYCIEGDGSCDGLLVNTFENKILGQQKAEVFPNPATRMINIKLPRNYNYQDCSIEIFNTVGQSQLNRKLAGEESTIDISPLPTGSYFYRIINGIHQLGGGIIIRL